MESEPKHEQWSHKHWGHCSILFLSTIHCSHYSSKSFAVSWYLYHRMLLILTPKPGIRTTAQWSDNRRQWHTDSYFFAICNALWVKEETGVKLENRKVCNNRYSGTYGPFKGGICYLLLRGWLKSKKWDLCQGCRGQCSAGALFLLCASPALCHLNGAQKHPKQPGVGCILDKDFEQWKSFLKKPLNIAVLNILEVLCKVSLRTCISNW